MIEPLTTDQINRIADVENRDPTPSEYLRWYMTLADENNKWGSEFDEWAELMHRIAPLWFTPGVEFKLRVLRSQRLGEPK